MATDICLKAKLKDSLLNHESVIRLPVRDAQGILREVINSDPKIMVYTQQSRPEFRGQRETYLCGEQRIILYCWQSSVKARQKRRRYCP